MTPQEQKVYAWMGASPLIRLQEEFKDPKTVLVTVRAPGENLDPSAPNPSLTAPPEPKPEPEALIPPALEPEEVPELEPEPAGRPVVRRRRRRSSASED